MEVNHENKSDSLKKIQKTNYSKCGDFIYVI